MFLVPLVIFLGVKFGFQNSCLVKEMTNMRYVSDGILNRDNVDYDKLEPFNSGNGDCKIYIVIYGGLFSQWFLKVPNVFPCCIDINDRWVPV